MHKSLIKRIKENWLSVHVATARRKGAAGVVFSWPVAYWAEKDAERDLSLLGYEVTEKQELIIPDLLKMIEERTGKVPTFDDVADYLPRRRDGEALVEVYMKTLLALAVVRPNLIRDFQLWLEKEKVV